MLTFEVPLVRIRMGKREGFTNQLPPQAIPQPSPSARILALAHRIVRAVEQGEVRDFSEVARRLGVSQARVSMVVTLTFLAPEVQAAVMLANGRRISQKRLLKLARMESWEEQITALEEAKTRQRIPGRNSPNRNPIANTGPILAQKPLESASRGAGGNKGRGRTGDGRATPGCP